MWGVGVGVRYHARACGCTCARLLQRWGAPGSSCTACLSCRNRQRPWPGAWPCRRFAQRVAMVRNELSVNEEVDPHAIIRRLRQEVSCREAREALMHLPPACIDQTTAPPST